MQELSNIGFDCAQHAGEHGLGVEADVVEYRVYINALGDLTEMAAMSRTNKNKMTVPTLPVMVFNGRKIKHNLFAQRNSAVGQTRAKVGDSENL